MARRRHRHEQTHTVGLPADVRDIVAENLLAELERVPNDDGIRAMLADRLDDIGPTWVCHWCMANEFRLAWIRGVKTDRSRLDSGSVWRTIMEHYDGRAEFGHRVVDHFGACLLFGQRCFVTEPYNWHRDRLLDATKSIAAITGGTPVVCGRTAHASELPNQIEELKRALIIPAATV